MVYMPTSGVYPTQLDDYREKLMITLSSARELAAGNIQRAQRRYKEQYDRGTRSPDLRVGEWVFVRFPQDETGRLRKLSMPWHGPYRILERRDPDVTVTKVYHPQQGEIRVHQSRVCRIPNSFPAGYYWYGGRCSGPGRPPKWVEKFLETGHPSAQSHIGDSQEYEDPALERNDDTQKEEEVPAVEGENDTLGEEDDSTAEGGDDMLEPLLQSLTLIPPRKETRLKTARTTVRPRSTGRVLLL